MSLPMTPNTTCDIYRNGNAPPNPPDVAGVKCYFKPTNRHYINTGPTTGSAAAPYHDHMIFVGPTVDIRDGYGSAAGGPGPGANADSVYIPNKNSGATYIVAYVQRVGLGTAGDHKRVYLIRYRVTWPSNDV